MSDQQIYRSLIDWLKQTWWDMPEADELTPLMMATYTPEEAYLLTGMPFSGRNLEELAEMKQMDAVELRHQLDDLAKKGIVFRSVTGDTIRYSLNDSFFLFLRSAFWAGRTDERSKAMARLVQIVKGEVEDEEEIQEETEAESETEAVGEVATEAEPETKAEIETETELKEDEDETEMTEAEADTDAEAAEDA